MIARKRAMPLTSVNGNTRLADQDASLADRLLDESIERHRGTDAEAIECAADRLRRQEIFVNRTAILLSGISTETAELRAWLETMLGLNVITVEDTASYHEVLYKYAGYADIVVIDDRFFGQYFDLLWHLLRLAEELYHEEPIIRWTPNALQTQRCETPSADWDISMPLPASYVDMWKAVALAADITLNGKCG